MKNRVFMDACLAVAASFAMASAHGQEAAEGSALRISGYFSVVGGAVVSGSMSGNSGPSSVLGKPCPCYMVDYANAGVYGSEASLKEESRAGLLAQYTLDEKTSLVGGLEAHASDSSLDVSAAYVKRALSDALELRVGRQRIPLYYYSNLQGLGAVLPWTSAPSELYGWDATYFNGASARYVGDWGPLRASGQIYAGSEHVVGDSFYKFSYGPHADVDWTGLAGAELELSRGAWTARLFGAQSDVFVADRDSGARDRSAFKAVGVAAFYDRDGLLGSLEATSTRRDYFTGSPLSVPSVGLSVGAGMRFGRWTPFASWHSYQEESSDLSAYEPVGNKRVSLTLRYDVDSNTALKFQIDRNVDSKSNYGGDANVVRLSLDKMFF